VETRAEYVLVGAFVLALVVALAVALLWFARVQFNSKAVSYDVYFEGSVSGLNNGSDVRYSGVPVGRVTDIELDPNDPQRVRVTVEIKPDVVIRTDAVAELSLQGLTGGAFVEIEGASKDAPPVEAKEGERYPVIATKQSNFQDLVNAAPELLHKLSDLADSLNDAVNTDNRAALAATLGNLRQVTDVIAAHSRDIDTMFGQLNTTLKHFDETATKLADTASHLDQLVNESRQPVHNFATRGLPELQALILQAEKLVGDLSHLSASLGRDPARLLYGDRQQGYRPQ